MIIIAQQYAMELEKMCNKINNTKEAQMESLTFFQSEKVAFFLEKGILLHDIISSH